MSFAIAGIAFAQCPSHQEETKQTLTLKTMGNVGSAHGHYLPFRVYSASDGTTGRLVMATYDSLEDAQKKIVEWTKTADEVTCREQPHQKEGDQRTSERIFAQAISTKDSKTKIFIIIRRDGLNCYLIESSSAQVAGQIEGLIKQPTGQ
jgi:flagellar motor protein MotB